MNFIMKFIMKFWKRKKDNDEPMPRIAMPLRYGPLIETEDNDESVPRIAMPLRYGPLIETEDND